MGAAHARSKASKSELLLAAALLPVVCPAGAAAVSPILIASARAGQPEPEPEHEHEYEADPRAFPAQVRILHMSDSHCLLTQSVLSCLPPADIFIHTGDFTNYGSAEEFAEFNAALHILAVQKGYSERIVVLGNHDTRQLKDDWTAYKSMLPNATHVLCHEGVSVKGLSIYGVPWYHGHGWRFQRKIVPAPGSPFANDPGRFSRIPSGLDLLLTHGPAHSVLDVSGAAKALLFVSPSVGSLELAAAIHEKRPKCHLFGHVHEAKGVQQVHFCSALPAISQADPDEKVNAAAPHNVGTSTGSEGSYLAINSAVKDGWNLSLYDGLHIIVAKKASADSPWSFEVESST